MKYIFAHGMGQRGRDWQETVSLLGSGFDPECPDIREMSGSGSLTYENLREGFFAYCNSFSGKVNLCGLSLGGMLALDLAVNFPEKVHSLALIGTQFKSPKNLLKAQSFIFKLMPEKAFKGAGFGKEEFMGLSASMAELDFTEGLSDISCETLIICGKRDLPNQRAARELAGKIPQAGLKIIPWAGHEVNKDNPQQLAEALMEFYKI